MRRGLLASVTIALTAVLVGCMPFGTCDETAPRSASVPALGVTSVRIVAEAGDLKVHGQSGVTEVAAVGLACALNAGDLERLQFATETNGPEIVIEARTGPHNSRFDATIEVPDSFQVEIEDGSGDIDVRDVAGVRLDDGSGDADISGVAGEVVVAEDGSGDLTIQDTGGNVEIVEDGSGDVTIQNTGGNVEILNDGSGGITVSDVDGSFHVGDVGSGDITARDVRGDFVVDDAGSGDVRHSGIGGRVDIP